MANLRIPGVRELPRFRLTWVLALGYIALLFINALLTHHGMWDFDVYWRATHEWLIGNDPYAYAGSEGPLPFVYPPVFLLLFTPFGSLPHGPALLVFTLLKMAAVVLLLISWWRLPENSERGLTPAVSGRLAADLFPIFAVLSFSAALPGDCYTGNITVFEQALFWTGIALALRGRAWRAGAFIVAASLVKIHLILLLPVLLIGSGSRAARQVLVYAGAFAGIWLLQAALAPGLFSRFLGIAGAHQEWTGTNTSSLAVAGSLAQWFGDQSGLSAAARQYLPYLLWLAMSLLFIVAYAGTVAALIRRGLSSKPLLVFLTVALYASVVPIMGRYSFIIMIVPAWFALARNAGTSAALGFLLFMLPIHGAMPAWGPGPLELIQDYFPIVLTWIVFWILRAEAERSR